MARTAHIGAVASGPERLESPGRNLAGVVSSIGTDPVVSLRHEGVLESLGREVAVLLSDPFLQPAVRHDPEYHPYLLKPDVDDLASSTA
jgi:hypothetical protein